MEIAELDINKIVPSPFQPRETFDKEALEELAESISEFDLLNPILVRRTGEDTYQIIAGERRWRAAQFAGLTKIAAIIKDIDENRQKIESLIENVHRRDLLMIEKGRGVLEIFRASGFHMGPKSLANLINSIERKKAKNLPLIPMEEQVDAICTKIHVKPNTLRLWLEAASVNPEIIKKELQKPDEERIPERILSRLSTIQDDELQKKAYAKIISLNMNKDEASKFVTQIKKMPKEEQEAVLTEGIPIEIVGNKEEGYSIEVPKEKVETIKKTIDVQKSAEVLLSPIKEERSRHRKNIIAHQKLLEILDDLFCPYTGQSAKTHLRWITHPNKTLEEALEQAKANLEESNAREEPDPRFLEK
ncbi:MAG: ParB/RepB/Spo0J family partition protein [Candidatus Heimdallarchaeaceae archaeon]